MQLKLQMVNPYVTMSDDQLPLVNKFAHAPDAGSNYIPQQDIIAAAEIKT